jgi:hypothetical protein
MRGDREMRNLMDAKNKGGISTSPYPLFGDGLRPGGTDESVIHPPWEAREREFSCAARTIAPPDAIRGDTYKKSTALFL